MKKSSTPSHAKKQINPYFLSFANKKNRNVQSSSAQIPFIKRTTKVPREEGALVKVNTIFPMPINKYIAHCGQCSRRESVDWIKQGWVKLNQQICLEPHTRVTEKDKVFVHNKLIIIEETKRYILLNKPKDYITTTKDPQERKTVFDLVKHLCNERVYPIGRLDRNSTGVLLLTNDGVLTQQLTHPSFGIKKIYEVRLNRSLTARDTEKLEKGIMLEDGLAQVDQLAFLDVKDKSILGIEIHSGKNRIIRRMFNAIGYDVVMLDRVCFGPFTKKNLPRGKCRFLTQSEMRQIKHFHHSFVKKQITP